MQITVEVPDSLGQKLQQFHDRLPEILERGIQELLNEGSDQFSDWLVVFLRKFAFHLDREI